jgi:Tol biopolymer transport system component
MLHIFLSAIFFVIGIGTLGAALFGRLRRRRLVLLALTLVLWLGAAALFLTRPDLEPTTAPPEATNAPVTTPTPPPPVGRQGRLIFASQRSGNFDIWLMDLADPTQVQQLTHDPANDVEPRWSPDGHRILFSSTRERMTGINDLWVMEADGRNARRLLDWADSYEWGAAWSPDGRWIAFTSTRDFDYEIYLMPADGSAEPINLTQNDKLDSYPDWAPDGRRIVFVSDRSGNWDLWTMDAVACLAARQEGRVEDARCQAVQLTDNPDDDIYPRWSPDGSHIAFESRREANRDIYRMDPDGSNVTRLTDSFERDSTPIWVDGGRGIVFAREANFDVDLFLLPVTGGEVIQLTHSKGEDRFGDWKP